MSSGRAAWNETISRREVHQMAAILASALIAMWVLGELIPVNDGFGFGDGRTYGHLGRIFPEYVLGGYLDQYRAARVLPSLFVYVANKLLPTQVTVESTVFLFRSMNLVSLVASSYAWGAIARGMGLRRSIGWLGFFGIFGNFAVLKMAMYYPTLIDAPTLALAVFLLHFHLARSTWGVGVCAALAAWVMPPLFVIGLVLFLLPRPGLEAAGRSRGFTALSVGLAIAGGASVAFGIWRADMRTGGRIVGGGAPVVRPWFWVSVTLAALFVALAAAPLIRALFERGQQFLANLPVRNEVLGAGLRVFIVFDVIFLAFMTYKLGRPAEVHDTGLILWRLLHQAAGRPLVFFVSHVAYLGPIVALSALLWKRAAIQLGSFGSGMLISLGGLTVLLLGSESRTILLALPFMAVAIAVALQESPPSFRQVSVFAVVSLVVSRFWFPINQGSIASGDHMEFPGQYYFGNFGPWMGATYYWIFFVATICVLAVLAATFRDRKNGSSTENRSSNVTA